MAKIRINAMARTGFERALEAAPSFAVAAKRAPELKVTEENIIAAKETLQRLLDYLKEEFHAEFVCDVPHCAVTRESRAELVVFENDRSRRIPVIRLVYTFQGRDVSREYLPIRRK